MVYIILKVSPVIQIVDCPKKSKALLLPVLYLPIKAVPILEYRPTMPCPLTSLKESSVSFPWTENFQSESMRLSILVLPLVSNISNGILEWPSLWIGDKRRSMRDSRVVKRHFLLSLASLMTHHIHCWHLLDFGVFRFMIFDCFTPICLRDFLASLKIEIFIFLGGRFILRAAISHFILFSVTDKVIIKY